MLIKPLLADDIVNFDNRSRDRSLLNVCWQFAIPTTYIVLGYKLIVFTQCADLRRSSIVLRRRLSTSVPNIVTTRYGKLSLPITGS